MSEWISVKERLPEEGSMVVAAQLYEISIIPDAAVCMFYNGDFLFCEGGLRAESCNSSTVITLDMAVTHWTPLPEPLEAGQ